MFDAIPMSLGTASLLIITGFIFLVWGADRFVQGAAATADNLGVSPLIIGLTIVGFGTSAPEILVSITAALEGNPGLAVGNAVGSNIANVGLILGVTALIIPLSVKSEILKREYPIMFAVMLLSMILILDLELGRIDGMILITALIVMLFWLTRLGLRQNNAEPMLAEAVEEIPHMPLSRALFWLALGLIILLFSSKILVFGATWVAKYFHVSDLIIGLTIVAIGTSLPELAASIVSAYKKEHDLAIGNIIGSNMFNLLAVLGIPGILAPLSLDVHVLQRDFVFMIGLSIALFVFAYGFRGPGRINRIEAAILLSTYIGYMVLLYSSLSD